MPNDRKQDESVSETDIELAVDDLSSKPATSQEAEHVRGGSIPATPPGVPIPYPNASGGGILPGVSTASGKASA
jgi:hypothetical protein